MHNFIVLIPMGIIVVYSLASLQAVRHVWKQGVRARGGGQSRGWVPAGS